MFRFRKYQYLYMGMAIIFFLSFATAYGIYGRDWSPGFMSNPEPAAKKYVKPTVKADTRINKEIRYACGDRVTTTIPTVSEFIGLDYRGVAKKFPAAEGWVIDDTVPNILTIYRNDPGICPYHKDFRHMGIADGYLAVYEGPLGYNYKVLQREDIRVSNLPPEMQQLLQAAMDYRSQPADIQAQLKHGMEFETEERLNTMLENFDEFKQE
ncbi:MAG: BofC C-terminal domain-containing protein [Bacillota bacterium]